MTFIYLFCWAPITKIIEAHFANFWEIFGNNSTTVCPATSLSFITHFFYIFRKTKGNCLRAHIFSIYKKNFYLLVVNCNQIHSLVLYLDFFALKFDNVIVIIKLFVFFLKFLN